MMSLRSSLLEEQEALQDCNLLDDYAENMQLRLHYNQENISQFQALDTEVVHTKNGDISVAIQGDRNKKGTAILTLHDVGQNHVKCFQSFFTFQHMKPLLKNFTVYHINFPGQEDNATDLPDDHVYQSMGEMADVISDIINYFGLKKTICFGVGAGANVFIRFALKRPSIAECLVLVNGTINAASWSDWGYEKVCARHLKTKGMTPFTEDYLIWHYFGKTNENRNEDLVGLIREQIKSLQSPRNLGFLMESYCKRDGIRISRPIPGRINATSLLCGVLIITGDNSPAVEDTINLNARLDPSNTSWIKISEASSMVLEEQPTSVTNALILFLQGYGYALNLQPPTLAHLQEANGRNS